VRFFPSTFKLEVTGVDFQWQMAPKIDYLAI